MTWSPGPLDEQTVQQIGPAVPPTLHIPASSSSYTRPASHPSHITVLLCSHLVPSPYSPPPTPWIRALLPFTSHHTYPPRDLVCGPGCPPEGMQWMGWDPLGCVYSSLSSLLQERAAELWALSPAWVGPGSRGSVSLCGGMGGEGSSLNNHVSRSR